MSSSDGFLTSLQSIQQNLFRIGGPILLVFGVINCVISLIVFTQKNLRKSPCSIYLIAANIANFLYITLPVLFLILTTGYGIDVFGSNLFMCRFYYYTTYVLDILSPSYLILASIDRVLVTSSNARTRQRSTRRLAYICVCSGTLFWMLFHCHILFLTDIQEIAPGYFTCYFRAGSYVVFMSYYSLFVKAITVPLLMIIFGIWTAKNIQKVRQRRIAPIVMNTGKTAGNSEQLFHSKDRQFVLMVVVDICIYIACNAMVSVVIIYYQIVQNIGFTQISIFLHLVGTFLFEISFCIGCYAYLFVSKTFRKEVKRLFFCCSVCIVIW